MPRQVDTSYNEVLSRPSFYDEEQKEEYLQKRIMQEITEDAVPPLPNRQQELDYLEELEKDFRSDSWLHYRFRKLQAGPLRKPYKRVHELKKMEKVDYIINFSIGALVFSPLAIFIGRRMRVNPTGVQRVYFPRNMHRFPIADPEQLARRYFYTGFLGTCILGGVLFGNKFTQDLTKDEYYSRPDLKPFPAMVEDTEDIAKAKKELYETTYGYRNEELHKRGFFYRLFRPSQADYNIRYQDRRVTDNTKNTYNPEIGGFPSKMDLQDNHW